MRLRFFLAALTVCIAVAPLALAQQFSSLEERMSTADFKAAGLDKLTPEELARLNAFVRNEVNARTAQAHEAGVREQNQAAAGRIGFHDSAARDPQVTRIAGTFTGWDGHTKFVLDNGQVWEQIDSSSQFSGVTLENPVVRIEPAFMGSWILSVDGYNSTVRVKRIK